MPSQGVAATRAAAAGVEVAELHALLAAAVQQDVPDRLAAGRSTASRCRSGSASPAPGSAGSSARCAGPSRAPRRPRATARVHDHARRVEVLLHPEPAAAAAGAGRVVEREQSRLEPREAVAAARAGIAAREHQRPAFGLVLNDDAGHALRQRAARSRRTRRDAAPRRAHAQPVDHGVDRVVCGAARAAGGASSSTSAVDARAHEALRLAGRSSTSACSPLRSCTTGASSSTAVPSGSARTWSTIWLTVCAASPRRAPGSAACRRARRARAGSRRSR